MGEAIGAVLPLAVGVSLSPIPIIAVVLMLATPRGRANGIAFVLGWIVGLSVAGTIVLLVSGGAGASDDQAPATWVGIVKLVLGAALVVLAVVRWRRRPRGAGDEALPAWMTTIDRFTPAKSVGFGVALSAVNPKNLLITVGAAAAIAQTGTSAGGQAVALAVFVVLSTIGPAVPLAIYLGMGDRSTQVLASLRTWMAAHNTAIMCVLLLVIGVKLVGDGVAGLFGRGP
ncbi:Sap-like sulfolipid-1-addressing protein [Actinomycetospora succinea]|uniref:Sap-like sulfolipid-1-addressing protein n=1 Tax=Actinomycetospora succinea TaxID=663603 RepID=A0A4R6VIA9_9PSEU|nr:GAP family protein [Actinomycetospora succinea]TDQ62844.1 Sap-like sulfolipid-1-addressing protein [Actinomycetospora succinea]